MTCTDNRSQATRSPSPLGSRPGGRVRGGTGGRTGGRGSGPSEAPPERPEARAWPRRRPSGVPAAGPPRPAPQPRAAMSAGTPEAPFEPLRETQRTGGPWGEDGSPTCQVAGTGRIRLPATSDNVPLLQPRHRASPPLAPRRLQAHKEGWAVAATASASGQMASTERSRSQREGVEPGCGEL